MSHNIYDDLPDDHEAAFVILEEHFKHLLDSEVNNSNDYNAISYYKQRYCNQVIAAAKSLDINYIKDNSIPPTSSAFSDFYDRFEADVMNLIIQIRINHARRRKQYSVSFDTAAKQKIRHYIEQIRSAVEQSELSANKRDAIFKRLAELTLEIDRDRTRFEVVADAIRSVASLSGDVEREGAEPWWKWVKLIFGEIDEAKENEREKSLPSPEERKRLEPPRKQISPPDENRDMDDEIPF